MAVALYADANQDGVPDSGTPVDSTTTNDNGWYSLSAVAGSYVVVFTLPSGYWFTVADQGSDDAVDSDANPTTGRTGTYTLNVGETTLTVDAGLTQSPRAAVDKVNSAPPGAVMLNMLANDSDPNNDINHLTIDLDPSTPGLQTSLTMAFEGTWTVSPSYPGYVTFTPPTGFTKDPTPISYTVTDAMGNVSNVATIRLDYRPTATNDTSTGNKVVGGVAPAVTVDVLANDTSGDLVDPTTVQIVNPPAGSTLSPDGKTLTVSGEGTWTVLTTGEIRGEIRFEPQPGFTDDPTPIRYTVRDNDGNTSNSATVTIDYVQAGPACSAFPFTVVIDDLSTPGLLDVVIVDNQGIGAAGAGGLTSTVADGSMTVTGEIYFSGSTPKFSLARITARSKPLVGTTAEPENITLSTAFRSAAGGTIVVEATDSCYEMVAGQRYSLTTPLGGTTNGSVTFTETADLANDPFIVGPPGVSNTLGPYGAGAVSGSKVSYINNSPAYVSLDKKLTVTHPTGAKLTTMTAGGILSVVTEEALSPTLPPTLSQGEREETLSPSLLKYRHAAEAGELPANPVRSPAGLGSRPGTGLDRLEAYPTAREKAADYARAGDLLFARWGGTLRGGPRTSEPLWAAGRSPVAENSPPVQHNAGTGAVTLDTGNGRNCRGQRWKQPQRQPVRQARPDLDLQGVDALLSVEEACWSKDDWL